GYQPFAGAGYYKRNWSWSFVIDMSKGAYDTSNLSSTPTRKTPLPFTVSSLYNAIEKDVWALGVKNVLEIEGKLYVHGQYLPENPLFFNTAAMRPVTSVDPPLVEQYKEHPTEDVRYYQCLRFTFLRGYFYTWQQRRLARVALNNPAFDYGASTSLRQLASDDEYHLLFQELDEGMYLKVIEKQILETIFNFLEAHQIDTTELRQRQ